ncbi:MAG: glycosyltransferase family 4 protein [Gemmatimonadota bacterium]
MHLLFVANFPADTGYAWDTIEAVFRRVGERLVENGHKVTIAYAALPTGPPASMRAAPFDFVTFDYERVRTRSGVDDFVRLLRERAVDVLYLTDRETWSTLYGLYRRAGVRRIILHDRTSGARTRRGLLSRVLKRALHYLPGLAADRYIGVSAFVRDRLVLSNCTPAHRTRLVYNGIDLTRFDQAQPGALQRLIGIDPTIPVVFCSGRAQRYKGVQDLIDAAALLRERGRQVHFAFCGDGPYLDELRRHADRLRLDNFHFLGRRSDVAQLLGSATVAVVPSIWAEAFGLTVVEAMAANVALVATRTGGIPELVEDGVTGLLVDPGAPHALSAEIDKLLSNPLVAQTMARQARAVAHQRFSLERAAENLYDAISPLFDEPAAGRTPFLKPRLEPSDVR